MFDKERPIQESPFIFKPTGQKTVLRQVPRFDLTAPRPTKLDLVDRCRDAADGAVRTPFSDDDDVFLTPLTSKIRETMSFDNL